MVIDPAIETHYRTGYERSRLFPGGQPSLEYVRSMELLERLLPAPPARVLDVGGGPGTMPRRWPGAGPAARFTAALGDARELAEPDASQAAVLLFGPLYHLTEAGQRRQALAQARRVLAPGGRLLAMAVSLFASLLDGLYAD